MRFERSNNRPRNERDVIAWLCILVLISWIDIYLTDLNLTRHDRDEANPIVRFYSNRGEIRAFLVHKILFAVIAGLLGIAYYLEDLVVFGLQFASVLTLALGVGTNIVAYIVGSGVL